MADLSPAGDLSRLNPIVMPDAVGALPLAPGWKILIGVALVALAWLAWRASKAWWANRYRRAALRELRALQQEPERLQELPALLKRAALAAWPRRRVASLSGSAWQQFLDSTNPGGGFRAGPAGLLERLAYAGPDALTPDQQSEVCDACRDWLRRHRRDLAG